MTFSLSIKNGFHFDARHIIMFFGLVFGGLQTGFILLGEFVIYRLYLGGEGKWIGMFILVCTFLISIFFSKIYKSSNRSAVVTFIAGIVFSIHPALFLYFYDANYVLENLPMHIFAIPTLYLISIWMLISLFNKAVSDKELFINYTQNEKFEAISHVAASLAHEVRNPLTAVKGFMKLIRQSDLVQSKVDQYIDISLDEIERTEAIISEYLAISKPPSKQRGHTDLSLQLQVIMDIMTPYANMSNVQIDIDKPEFPVWILANVDEIKQVLVNFVKNAIEACSEVPNAKVSLSLVIEDRNAILVIKDNGTGMNEDQINRLGSIYFSSKSSGTGLGLTFSFQVIRALGGTVSVQSEPQAGALFTISLPLHGFSQKNN